MGRQILTPTHHQNTVLTNTFKQVHLLLDAYQNRELYLSDEYILEDPPTETDILLLLCLILLVQVRIPIRKKIYSKHS